METIASMAPAAGGGMLMALAALVVASTLSFYAVHRLRRTRGLNFPALLAATVAGALVFNWIGIMPAGDITRVAFGLTTMLGIMYAFLAGLFVNVVLIARAARKPPAARDQRRRDA